MTRSGVRFPSAPPYPKTPLSIYFSAEKYFLGRKSIKPPSQKAEDFYQTLFSAADKLRKNLEPFEYKYIVLGLIFLRYISTAFETKYQEILASEPELAEDRDAYLAENIFWVPEEARWSFLKKNAHISGQHPNKTGKMENISIGLLVDRALEAVEKDNPTLKGVLPSGYADPSLDQSMIGDLIELISNEIKPQKKGQSAQDLLGQVYEYFLGGFAGREGKRGGEFYTPRCVVQLLVKMLEPTIGERLYDPCCGSGGMFIQSEKFIEDHGGRIGDIAIYGQESNQTTWKLAKMNLAVRGISANICWNNGGSFLKDELPDERFEVILANPPFNDSAWWDAALEHDVRWRYGTPPQGNANFAWMSHILHHLAPNGRAGVVLANGSMSSGQKAEAAIRQRMIEEGVVDCMVALPGQMFFTTQIPACLWFLNKKRAKNRKEILFIDARKMGEMVSRTRRELTTKDIEKIAQTYHAWQGQKRAESYENIKGFCYAASLEEVQKNDFVTTPGRYVGTEEKEENLEDFAERFSALRQQLLDSLSRNEALDDAIRQNLSKIILPEQEKNAK